MRTPRADSVYFTVVLVIALSLVGVWSLRARGDTAPACGDACGEPGPSVHAVQARD
ncbi:MAG: hypothetical protein MI723_04780 [Caulobacterales bacterium]|nr:hypothetical protein [Caulobacterales bacterium]